MLKKLSIVLFIFSFSVFRAQGPPKNQGNTAIQNLVTTLDHDTCLNKQFSIVFYVVLDSLLSPRSATQPTLNAIIDTLNSTFKPICVSFVSCSTVYIPNYPYNRWKRSATEPAVIANWYTDKTINFYIVDSVKDESSNPDVRGYAHAPRVLPTDTVKDVIVVEQFRSIPPEFNLMMHSFGHFFGLTETWYELNPAPEIPGPPSGVISKEFVDASNGLIHGDLIPDTEADPGPSAKKWDGKGHTYIRPTDNFMTLFKGCRFTQQQYNWMAHAILTRRLYLH